MKKQTKKGESKMAVEISNYKGNPIICLNPESKYKFSFGVAKAKMILAAIKEIENFVKDNERPDAGYVEYAKEKETQVFSAMQEGSYS